MRDPVAEPFVTASTVVHVRDFQVDADIGVRSHEIGVPQPLILSVSIETADPVDDNIDTAFDYSLVFVVAEALARQRIGLIETFARRLAEACLEHPLAYSATVSIAKPRALPRGLAGVTVSLVRANRRSGEPSTAPAPRHVQNYSS